MVGNRLVPELSVINIKSSKSFYLDLLGFEVEYERQENKFAFIKYEESSLMIEEVNENWNSGPLEYPFGKGINLFMTVSDVNKIYDRIKDSGYKIFLEMKDSEYRMNTTFYKCREFIVQDPDGYLLRFAEDKEI